MAHMRLMLNAVMWAGARACGCGCVCCGANVVHDGDQQQWARVRQSMQPADCQSLPGFNAITVAHMRTNYGCITSMPTKT